MSHDEHQALLSRISELEDLARVSVKALTQATDQIVSLQNDQIATLHALAAVAGHLQGTGVIDGSALAEMAIENAAINGLDRLQIEKLIRDLLIGTRLELPARPQFTVIRGGKDEPPPEAT